MSLSSDIFNAFLVGLAKMVLIVLGIGVLIGLAMYALTWR